MAPPQLPAHRPIALFAEPIEIALRIALGHDLHAAVGHGIHRRLGQMLHPHEPLIGQIGLDRRLRAVGMGQIDFAVFDLVDQAQRFQIGHDALPGLDDRTGPCTARRCRSACRRDSGC